MGSTMEKGDTRSEVPTLEGRPDKTVAGKWPLSEARTISARATISCQEALTPSTFDTASQTPLLDRIVSQTVSSGRFVFPFGMSVAFGSIGSVRGFRR
jgi:hypothetical protein